jgi:hypothetical protein
MGSSFSRQALLVLLAALATIGTVGATDTAAGPSTFPGRPGKVIYGQAKTGPGGDLYLVNPSRKKVHPPH